MLVLVLVPVLGVGVGVGVGIDWRVGHPATGAVGRQDAARLWPAGQRFLSGPDVRAARRRGGQVRLAVNTTTGRKGKGREAFLCHPQFYCKDGLSHEEDSSSTDVFMEDRGRCSRADRGQSRCAAILSRS